MQKWLKPNSRAEFSGGGATSNSGIATVSEVNAISAAEKPYKAEFEYIETTGSQYIDTGIIGKSGLSCDLNMSLTGYGDSCFLGSRNTYNNRVYLLHFYGDYRLGYGYHYGANVPVMLNEEINVKTTLNSNEQTMYVDGQLVISKQVEADINTNLPMYLFSLNYNGRNHYNMHSGTRFYSGKIYDNGELVRDYVAVLDNNDVACLYDKVSKQCFYNEGAEDFVAGPITYVVPEPEPTPPTPTPEPEPEPTPVLLDSVDFQIGANSGENNMLNVDLGFSLNGFAGDVTSIESASDTLNAVDELKKTLNEKRSEIGVSRNRIDGIIESQSIKIENLSASHSTIVDTDFARETAALTRNQILQQATSSLLAQANITQQLALQLLQ